MKQTILLIISMTLGMAACKKTKEIYYHSSDNIYFDFSSQADRDSVVYTFAYDPTKRQDTILLPVRISGIRTDHDRKYSIMVLDSGTTAKPGTHYQPLQGEYTMPADSGSIRLPVIIFNTDASLEQTAVQLRLKLLPSEDLDTTLNTLITAKIVFSNKLEEPNWWSMWLGSYYSRVKHQLFIIVAEVTSLTTDGLDAPRNLYLVSKLTTMLDDPFTWVTDNPEKGYMLTQRSDGSYDFYHADNPTKTILLRENTAAGKYYFIDENGDEVY